MYYIGIDGGGTNTVGVIGDRDGILFQLSVGPSNYHNIGILKTKETLSDLIEGLTKEVGCCLSDVTALCFGGAGVDTLMDQNRIEKIIKELGYFGKLSVINDALVAMAAENGSLSGGILISGTGSIAYGVDSKGHLQRVGGWGHIVDDAGSAYDIAVKALKAILKSYDGRGESTSLFNTLKDKMQISNEEEIIDYLYNRQNGKDQIAKLAQWISLETKNDPVAEKIITEAASDLLLSIMALDKKCNVDFLNIVLSGSVLIKNDEIVTLLNESVPNHIKLRRLSSQPVQGAYILATQL